MGRSSYRLSFPVPFLEIAAQDMLENKSRFVGEGRVRKVHLVEYEGRTLAIKELKHPRGNLRLHRLEVVTMDVVS